jgi:CheY-like chemotaxis protein
MPPETAAHVFEPFFTTKPDGMGTGLGLATVYGAVQQAGGTIELDSRVGEGTTFTLRFPVCEDALAGGDAEESLELGEPSDRTILVVEDEPAVRDFIRRILESHGFRVLAAGPDDALAALERHDGALDLVVAALVMPGISGPQVAERLLALRPGTPVLYMSGHGAEFALRSGMVTEDDALLAKPFGADTLVRRVHDALQAAEALPEAA